MQKDKLDYFLEETAMGIAAIIGIALIVATIVTLLGGCASQHALTPAQVAATQPDKHPLAVINTFIAHGETTLEFFDVIAFIASLAGLGIAVWGLVEANTMIERLGLMVAAVGGAVTAGTTAGIIVLPFSPWIVLVIFVSGVGYGAYILYEEYIVKKPVVGVASTPSK